MSRARSPHDEETVDVAKRSSADPLSLRVLLGDRALSHPLPTRGSVVLGRGEDVEVFIEHRSVSRRHARVTIEGAAIVVEDLGSANGTRIAGKSVAPGAKVPVRAGDAIEIGDVVVVIQRAKAPPVAAASARAAVAGTATTLGSSAQMQAVSRLIDRIAPGTISALIVGETGVGKELVAEAIHRRSPRASRPLVRLNCAAVAASLLESEWFGYEKGAFSGANAAKPGLLEMAEGGTVLFDELAEMPIDLQAKLLRVLEDRAVLRVGAVRPRRIDVRFLAATNRDLETESARGTFRQDLYFRLNGVTIAVPPLRERREEVAALAHTFLTEMSREADRRPPSIDAEALGWLEAYSWPGNVRELRNVIERALLLVDDGGAITTAELPKTLRPGARASQEGEGPRSGDIDTADEPAPSRGESLKESVSAMEKKRVLAALAEAAGNQKRAAEILGISRGTLLARLQAFGIARPRKS